MIFWDFPKIRLPYLGVLVIRILLFRVLYWGYLGDSENTYGVPYFGCPYNKHPMFFGY